MVKAAPASCSFPKTWNHQGWKKPPGSSDPAELFLSRGGDGGTPGAPEPGEDPEPAWGGFGCSEGFVGSGSGFN